MYQNKFTSTCIILILILFMNLDGTFGACHDWRDAGTVEPVPTCFSVCQTRCLIFMRTSEFSCPRQAIFFAKCKCCKR